MFALRGIAVSLTFFALFYCLLSALVSVSWRGLRWLRANEQSRSDLLFLLRVFPLFASVIVTFAFVVPSFQLLEPRSIDEGVGTMPATLGLAALLLIGYGCYRVIRAQIEASRIVARWIEGSQALSAGGGNMLVLRSRRGAPPLLLAGMRKPRVLVSEPTVELLTPDELQIALRHEFVHIGSWDNLKKLLFRCCPFPALSQLEAAWSQAAEFAADEAAVTNASEAVNLASALVKLSRLVPVEAAPACTVGLVTGSLAARVQRLLAWDESRKLKAFRIPRWAAMPPILGAVFCAFLTYRPVLLMTHEFTEWLVR